MTNGNFLSILPFRLSSCSLMFASIEMRWCMTTLWYTVIIDVKELNLIVAQLPCPQTLNSLQKSYEPVLLYLLNRVIFNLNIHKSINSDLYDFETLSIKYMKFLTALRIWNYYSFLNQLLIECHIYMYIRCWLHIWLQYFSW